MLSQIQVHELTHAFGGALGIALLVAAFLCWGNIKSKADNPLPIVTLVMFGLFFCLWVSHSAISSHKLALTNILKNSQSGSDIIVGLAVGMLGVVMAFVTMGVISISRSAIEDMRTEREAMKKQYRAMECQASDLTLTQHRMQLAYENEKELIVLKDNDIIRNFRDPLQVYYQQRDALNGYLDYLNCFYDRDVHNSLMDIEKDYLYAIKLHYKLFPEKDINNEISTLLDSIINKL